MKRSSLDQLLKSKSELPYEKQYEYIMHLLVKGSIRPVKASGTNGKKPALYLEYWQQEAKKDYSHLEEELKFHIVPLISVDYYLSHLDTYEKDRPWVLLLNNYLKENSKKLMYTESQNERSYEIWGREKFLTKEQGRKILKRCGISENFLNTYGTTEPLSYYSHTRKVPQNLLILENKDTFYSMRRHLLDENKQILGAEFGTLIYGAGKGIIRSFGDFDLCVEPYMKAPGNQIYYFGDLDYEGIGIYERLEEEFHGKWEIIPFVRAYEAMLNKAGDLEMLPATKEKQNRNISQAFFSYFEEEQVQRMQGILEAGKYIPQEILNITDF
ncbi:MAG: DUF2220 family protein [Bariatricus sp.]|nr:DUF2220 family protein [Bariatricus sp.]